jgi:predicted O-linked N-acetylglucosamine transferase (SPINDLY family)
MASPNTLLRAVATCMQARQFEQAERLLDQLIRAFPDNREARYQLARARVARGDIRAGIALLEELLTLDAGHVQAWRTLAALTGDSGNWTRAEACYRRAAELAPEDAGIPYNLALLFQRQGRLDEAGAWYQRAIEINAGLAQAHNNLGNIHLLAQRHAAAADCYRRALELDPQGIEALFNLGMALTGLGRDDEALACYRDVLRRQPRDADAMCALGAIFSARGADDEAIVWYRRASQADPRYYDAQVNLGRLLMRRADVEALVEAERALRQAVGVSAAYTEAHDLLGNLLELTGQREAWLENYRRSAPPGAEMCLAHALYGYKVANYCGDFDALERCLTVLLEHDYGPEDLPRMSAVLLSLQYQDVSQEALYRVYRRHAELTRQVAGDVCLSRRRQRAVDDKIRVGYVSSDFSYHVMGWIMADVLGHHDKSRFELYLYALGDKQDDLTERFRSLADKFVRLRTDSARAAAELIAMDELDILVDLVGHTAQARALIYAYKPAPLQLTHLGYHGTLGMDAIAYKITDAHADVPENERFLVERLLPMRHCLMPFHHEAAAEVTVPRSEIGIAEDALVLGVFVHITKLSQRCLAAWKRVLDGLPNAVLAFSPLLASERASYLTLLAAVGIVPERVKFIPARRDLAEARARYRLVDMALDTFPYSGGDTTMAALDMAVPIVTLCGTRQCERMTYSILKHLGLEECIAYNEDEFVDLACALGRDPARRATIARAIPELLVTSGMADMRAYTASLEETYLRALAADAGSMDSPGR